MTRFPEIFTGIRVGPKPTEEDLAELKRHDIKTVVDFRSPAEVQTSSGSLVEQQGMTYRHIPFSRDDPDPAAVAQLEQVMAHQAGPFLLHCGSGIRALTVYLLSKAKREGWSADRVEQEAKANGFDLSTAPALQRFVHDYLQKKNTQ